MPNYTDEEEKRARDSFTAQDRLIAEQNPEYGDQLAQIKVNYNAATTDEERKGWHDEAEKLSQSYGYTRNNDGSNVSALESNLKTIQNFDNAYGKKDTNGYQAVINALLGDISGAKFKYSAKDDPRYVLAQEYASDAMRNQMAESAALTGGYGNSYASEVGQKVYDSYMDSAVNDMEDRAYTRWQNEQSDKYNRLNTLIGLDQTAYSRQRDAVEDARYENELAISKENTDYTRKQNEKTAAQNRIMTYLENGGDPKKLDSGLIETSGLTNAEMSAIRDNVLANIAAQKAASTAGQIGEIKQDENPSEEDAEGLFIAAYASENPAEYITKNYKEYGFSSVAGLQQRYLNEFSEDINGMDVSQSDADAYLEENGISASSVLRRDKFYENGRTVGGKTYASYADYIDDVVENKISAGAKRAEFSNIFSGYLSSKQLNQ